MSSQLITTQLLLTSDTAQPLNVTRNVANQSIEQIFNMNLRALAHILIHAAPQNHSHGVFPLTRALLEALGNEGKFFFLI